MKNIELEQGTLEWLKFRNNHIGASDIAVILGISPFKSQYQLWIEKTKREEPSDINSNYFMLRGKALEAEARLTYSEVTGNIVIPAVKQSSEWDVAIASLDGITMNEDILCEIKCPSQKSFDFMKNMGIQEYYEAQVQWQLWVTKAKRCDFFAYIDDNTHQLIEVFPNLDYQEKLIEKAKEFWNFVENNTAPEASEKDHVYIEDQEANDLALQWKFLKQEDDRLKKERKEIESKLLEFTDDGNCIFPQSKVKLTRINRKGIVDWEEICKVWKISEDDLNKHRKESIGFVKFSIS